MSSDIAHHRPRFFGTSAARVVACACVLAAGNLPARAEDIVAVLERSQALRLASLAAAATSERAVIVRRSFDALATHLDAKDRFEIRIVTGPVIAECLHGRIIVANESLADQSEPVRLFLLAHEIGHAQLGHWHRMTQLYSTHLPGQIAQATARPHDSSFLLEASSLSQMQELAADAFAYETLRTLGYGFAEVVGALTAFGMQRDTAMHPGTGKRIAHLRSLG